MPLALDHKRRVQHFSFFRYFPSHFCIRIFVFCILGKTENGLGVIHMVLVWVRYYELLTSDLVPLCVRHFDHRCAFHSPFWGIFVPSLILKVQSSSTRVRFRPRALASIFTSISLSSPPLIEYIGGLRFPFDFRRSSDPPMTTWSGFLSIRFPSSSLWPNS